MTATLTEVVSKQARPAEGVLLFLRRWLAHPLRMGSIVPSSQTLCKRLVRHGWPRAGTVVLELGAGTGVVSRAFLDAGLSPERLVVVEVDSSMVRHLRDTLPGVTVIEGDARNAADLMPARFKGRIGSVICGIPLVLLPVAEQRRFTHAMEAVAPGRGFLHFSYCVTSPLSGRKLGLRPKREAWTPLNLPPASVWRYTQAA
jgi:phosphatidylethanolamine/phosphatidyl-N-methylethanolamine N-methyltransferase